MEVSNVVVLDSAFVKGCFPRRGIFGDRVVDVSVLFENFEAALQGSCSVDCIEATGSQGFDFASRPFDRLIFPEKELVKLLGVLKEKASCLVAKAVVGVARNRDHTQQVGEREVRRWSWPKDGKKRLLTYALWGLGHLYRLSHLLHGQMEGGILAERRDELASFI